MHGRNVLRRRVVACDMTVEGVEEGRKGPTLGAVRALDSFRLRVPYPQRH
jgi:hypothetical protein